MRAKQETLTLEINGVRVMISGYDAPAALRLFEGHDHNGDGDVLDTDVSGGSWYRQLERWWNA